MRIAKIGVLALVLFTIAAYSAGCGSSVSSGKVLVEVDGDKITDGDLTFLSDINPRIAQQIASPEGKKKILENLIEQNLLYQAAVKEGVNRDPKVKAKADLYRRVIIAQAMVDNEIDKAAQKYYDDNQDEFKKLKLSQILISFGEAKDKKDKKARTEADALKLANEIKAKLDGGAKFEDLTQEYSDDQLTKARGGNLGLVAKNDKRLAARGYEPVLEKAFEMKVGEVSGPIKAQDGYHIITLTRGIELEPFEEAKQAILFKVRGDARDKLLADLKKDAKVVFVDKELAPEAGSGTIPEAGGTPPTIKVEPQGETKPVPTPAPAEKKALKQ
ncbi:MAG: peptidylprolyl isomerase [bacterium]